MDNFIKDFWESQAEKYTTSHAASWGDNFAIDLEINTVGEYIKEGDVVLDMGCANGFAAIRHLNDRNPAKIFGLDYAPNMVKFANKVKEEISEKDKLDFEVGDILNIKFNDNTFDVVYTTRVIINLPNWKEQIRAIDECIRVAKPGGIIIFSEAFYEPLVLLNALRSLKQLPPLVEHDFNRYIKKDRLEKHLSNKNLIFECNEFSSVYYLGSRFLRELVTIPSDYPGYSNPINQLFYDIEKNYSGGGFGIQQAYIIKK
jgi:ubiquinone/menaquinone biosynthesis C-methylase UbiE